MTKKIYLKLREYFGLEEILFLSGMVLLYCGAAVQFSHSVAQMVCGAVLVVLSVMLTFKGSA
jgi:hypothetical protein